jgi:hypothetical protein
MQTWTLESLFWKSHPFLSVQILRHINIITFIANGLFKDLLILLVALLLANNFWQNDI